MGGPRTRSLSKADTTKALASWDFTLSYKDQCKEELIKSLRASCKKWVFQLEGTEAGYEHYQGRFSLIKKKTQSSLINFFKSNYPCFQGVHFSPSSSATHTTNNFTYVMKDDTRIKGPWSDKDEIKVLTKQMELFNSWGLYDWQSSLKAMADEFDMRTIDLIYDQDGNNGKSLFSEHMEYEGKAEEVPPFRLMDDIFQWVAGRPIKPCYIFDMPRGMKKDKLADFYSGIEVIKNGVAYDKRYNPTKKRFTRPRVFVFTNMLPQFSLMSKDRWRVWAIFNNALKKYEVDDLMWLDDEH